VNLSEATVQEIVGRILSASDPEKIIIFGSAATGTMDADSDIDVLVVSRCLYDARKQRRKLAEALLDIGYPIDLVLISSEWFDESKDVIGGIAYPANKYGKVVYDAA